MIQLQVINYIISSGDASFVSANNLRKEHFSEYANEFLFIKSHIDKYGNVPDAETFVSAFPDFELLTVSETPSYLMEELLRDYQTRQMAETFNKVRKLLMEGKVEEASAVYMQGSDALSENVALSCVDMFRDTTRYDEYVDRMNNLDDYYVSTGFKELDKIIGGIDLKEELGVVMARTNMGKSFITLKMAVSLAMAGKTVGLYSGEMSEGKVGYRMDTLIGHIPSGYLMHGNSSVQSDYLKYIRELPEKYSGSLKVMTPKMAGGRVTVSTLKAFMEKESLDVLFVDQLSLVDDERRGRTLPERQSNIIIDLKRLQTLKCKPIIAIAQQNRTTTEDGSIDSTQIAGSDDIGKYATWVIGISRDKKDETILKLKVVKARDGGAGKELTYYADFSTGKFTYIPDENEQGEAGQSMGNDRYSSGGDVF